MVKSYSKIKEEDFMLGVFFKIILSLAVVLLGLIMYIKCS